MKKYIFFIEQTYSFAILRPLQQEIWRQGGQVAWFLLGVDSNLLQQNELQCRTVKSVQDFEPLAVIVPGNRVPNKFPGIKVQVFHGFGIDKKGHFRVRGFFDLYCTHGPLTTFPFEALAKKHKHFSVVETGWPKMDSMAKLYDSRERLTSPYQILYAPTFSPSLTSAPALVNEFAKIARHGNYDITVKFHPKMNPEWVLRYKNIRGLQVKEHVDFLDCVASADIIISDTSSVVSEALCLGKPVITYKTLNPLGYCIDFGDPERLEHIIQKVSSDYLTYKKQGVNYVSQMHPYHDGKSSARVLSAIDSFSFDGLKSKPKNIFRYIKLNKSFREQTFNMR